MARNWLLPGLFGLFFTLSLAHSALGQTEKDKNKQLPATTSQTQPSPQDSQQDVKLLVTEADAAFDRKDYATAFEKYSAAADLGDIAATNMLGVMYNNGRFVDKDITQAMTWYRKAADAGDGIAMFNIGVIYSDGSAPVEQDPREALTWYRKSAEAGEALGMLALGDSYFTGTGVDEDQAEAVAWYQRAVDAGHAGAYWRLALRYAYGQGVGKDSNRAAELAYRALLAGVEPARDNLTNARNTDLSSNFLKRIQELLTEDGYYDGSIDGSFGPQTRDAIERAFDSDTEALGALFGF